jgi:hypothetical protein
LPASDTTDVPQIDDGVMVIVAAGRGRTVMVMVLVSLHAEFPPPAITTLRTV